MSIVALHEARCDAPGCLNKEMVNNVDFERWFHLFAGEEHEPIEVEIKGPQIEGRMGIDYCSAECIATVFFLFGDRVLASANLPTTSDLFQEIVQLVRGSRADHQKLQAIYKIAKKRCTDA